MPDGPVHRQFPRYQLLLPFLYRATPAAIRVGVGWTRDLSEGGACVALAERLPPGSPRWLGLQTDRGPIDTGARVAWAEEAAPNGKGVLHGVTFTQISPEHRQALRDLLRAQEGREAGVRLPVVLSVTCSLRGRAGPSLSGCTGDISRGGLSLRLLQPLPVGSALEITLHTPRGPLTVAGTVVWVVPPERQRAGQLITHGLRFAPLGWPTLLSLGLVLGADSPHSPS